VLAERGKMGMGTCVVQTHFALTWASGKWPRHSPEATTRQWRFWLVIDRRLASTIFRTILSRESNRFGKTY